MLLNQLYCATLPLSSCCAAYENGLTDYVLFVHPYLLSYFVCQLCYVLFFMLIHVFNNRTGLIGWTGPFTDWSLILFGLHIEPQMPSNCHSIRWPSGQTTGLMNGELGHWFRLGLDHLVLYQAKWDWAFGGWMGYNKVILCCLYVG